MSDYGEHTTPETTDKAGGADTESDGARDAVQNLVNEIGREQGGTESVYADGSKGNEDGFDLESEDRVNDNPMGNQYELDRDTFGNDHEGDSREGY